MVVSGGALAVVLVLLVALGGALAVLGYQLERIGYTGAREPAATAEPTPAEQPTQAEDPTQADEDVSPAPAATSDDAGSPDGSTAGAPTTGGVTATDLEHALQSALGIDDFRDLDPSMWGYYVTEIDMGGPSLARVTLQGDGATIAQGSSRAIFSLIGREFPDLEWVEVVDGTGTHMEQTHRADVPLLN